MTQVWADESLDFSSITLSSSNIIPPQSQLWVSCCVFSPTLFTSSQKFRSICSRFMTRFWCAQWTRIQSIKSSKPVLMFSRMAWVCIVALPANTQKPFQTLNHHSLLPLIRKDFRFWELTLQRGATRSNSAVGPSNQAMLPRFIALKAEMIYICYSD